MAKLSLLLTMMNILTLKSFYISIIVSLGQILRMKIAGSEIVHI